MKLKGAMKKLKKKKAISFLVLGIFVLSIFITAFSKTTNNKVNASVEINENDKAIASEISNVTGAGIDEVTKLKSEQGSWNKVLELLKSRNKTNDENEKNTRSDALAENGVDKEYIEKLKNLGFTNEQITEVKMLADRIIFQLNEITSENDNTTKQVETAEVKDNAKEGEEDITQYTDLSKKIKLNDAVYFMLMLENDYKSYEKVLDEYLYSLQVDLKLDKYIENKEAYQEEKDAKNSTIDTNKIITLSKIEEKLLQRLQKRNSNSQQTKVEVKNTTQGAAENSKTSDTSIQVPLPDVNNNRPKNPSEDIMKEINSINQKSLNP
jgi:hypothetical protein